METTTITTKEIPVDLWRQLKAKAAAEGSTIQESLAKAIAQYVNTAQSNAA